MLKRIVNPGQEYIDLWDLAIRPVVQAVFRELCSADKSVDVVAFEKFLNRGWRDAEVRVRRQQAGLGAVDDIVAGVTALRLAKTWRARQEMKKPEVPKFRRPAPTVGGVKARRAAPQPPPPSADQPMPADRTPGWEVREYLSRIAAMAQVPRPPKEQWQILAQAQRQLRARQETRQAVGGFRGRF